MVSRKVVWNDVGNDGLSATLERNYGKGPFTAIVTSTYGHDGQKFTCVEIDGGLRPLPTRWFRDM